MSHRPWETPSSRALSSPPPPPPPPPSVIADLQRHQYAAPLLPHPHATHNGNGKRRHPSAATAAADLPPPPPVPTPPLYNNYSRRFKYPTATSLSPLVSQLYSLALDLGAHFDPEAPRHHRAPLPDFPTLDDLGACLESVHATLHALPRPPQHPPPKQLHHPAPPPPPSSAPTTAHTTLQSENTHLHSALQRSQKRAETLEKKMIVLENEVETSALERERLSGSIEMLEETVEELRSERDDARVELRVSGAQWTRIVDNATRLEGAMWSEIGVLRLREKGAAPRGELCSACGDSSARLMEANEGLRKRVQALEAALERIKWGGRKMGDLVETLGQLGREIDQEVAVAVGRLRG